MSIKDAKLQNTILEPQNLETGGGYDPLRLPNLNKNMFCKIAFDYLSFTLPFSSFYQDEYDKARNILLLNSNKGEEFPTSRYGYRACTRWKNELNQSKETYTQFYYNGGQFNCNSHNEQTGMFELEGDGCRALESRGGDIFPDYWKTIFDSLMFNIRHCSITRFDFAIDVFNADFSLEDLQNQLIKRNVYSPFQKFDYSKGTFFKSEDVDAHILYLGSRKSDLFLCVYDKKEERESIGKEVEFDSWYRFEFRFKHKAAQNVILNILNKWDDAESLGEFAASLIKKYCDIKQRPKQGPNKEDGVIVSNKVMYNWETSPLWNNFIGYTKKAKLENYFKYESSITKNAMWAARSVSKTLAKMFCANPKYFQLFIQQLLVNGLTRFKHQDEALINDFREMYDFDKLTGKEIDEISEHLKIDIEKYIELYGEEIIDPHTGQLKGYGFNHDVASL